MNSRKELLRKLLQASHWTKSDEEMLRHYLESGDITELEELAREGYDASNANPKNLLSRQLSEVILKGVHRQIGVEKTIKTKLFNIYKLTAAAALIIVLGGACFIEREAIFNLFYPVKMVHVSTAAGEEKTVALADGSVATMEANSTLVFPEKFTGATRDVSLKGEAFFKVAKDKQHPFTVHSPLVNTTVVGTEFNVDDKDSLNAKVVVVSGIVKVQAANAKTKQEVRLTPEDGAVFGTGNNMLRKVSSPDDARFYKQRRDGIFVYNGVPVSAVVKDVERYYNTKVDVDGTIKDRIFHGSFKTGDSATTVLKIMAIAMNAALQEKGKGYSLTCANCK